MNTFFESFFDRITQGGSRPALLPTTGNSLSFEQLSAEINRSTASITAFSGSKKKSS